MNELRHEILDDGRVLVTLKGQIARLPPNEVKRFAWAVLNDLDPEEADNAGYVAPVIVLEREAKAEGAGRGPWQLAAILGELCNGELFTTNISARLKVDRTQCAIQLARLRTRGLVRCKKPGRSYSPALWEITGAGLIWLSNYERERAA